MQNYFLYDVIDFVYYKRFLFCLKFIHLMSKKSKKSTAEKAEHADSAIEKKAKKPKSKKEETREFKETNTPLIAEKKKKKKHSSDEKQEQGNSMSKSEKKKRKRSEMESQPEPLATTAEAENARQNEVVNLPSKKQKKSKKSKKSEKSEKELKTGNSANDINFSGALAAEDTGGRRGKKSKRERTASASMTFHEAQNHNVEGRQGRKRQLSYEKVYKSAEEQYQLDEVKEVLPFVKVSNVNLDQDTRVTTQKWRPSKHDIAPEKESFNSGMFSQTERESIEKAIERYLDEHGLSMLDLPYLIQPKLKKMDVNPYPQHRGFSAKIRDLSKVNRTIPQVYWYLRKKYSEYRIQDEAPTKWTPEDDKKLLHYINVIGAGKWTEIEQAMGRDGAKVSLNNARIVMIVCNRKNEANGPTKKHNYSSNMRRKSWIGTILQIH
jgi:hypothetical protein